MNVITLLIFLIWLACGVLVFRFVRRTGGFSEVGKVAHWFGGAFVMVGLAIGMTVIFAWLNPEFGVRANTYLLTHQLRPSESVPLVQRHNEDAFVTVYRRGSVNQVASFDGSQLRIDEAQTVRTSLWWMLWDTKFR